MRLDDLGTVTDTNARNRCALRTANPSQSLLKYTKHGAPSPRTRSAASPSSVSE